MQARIAANRGALERYERLCREVGAEPADVALAWLLQRPGVTAPIISPRTMDQLTTSVRAALRTSRRSLRPAGTRDR